MRSPVPGSRQAPEIEVTETALLDDKSLTRQYIEVKTRRTHRARRLRHRLFEPELSPKLPSTR
jgi:hypothetical protein